MNKMDLHFAKSTTLDLLWLELTSICDLQCSHCYADSGPGKGTNDLISQADFLRIIEEGAAIGCRRIQFIGGEPTTVRYLPNLLRHAVLCKYRSIEIFTNATHISDALISVIYECNASISVSFYCDDASVHDRITGVVGSHRRTVSNIRKMLAAEIPVSAHVIEMTDNQSRITETLDFLRDIGVPFVSSDPARHLGRAAQNGECDPGDSPLCGACGDRRLAILPDGTVSPCVMSRTENLGSIKHQSLRSILDDQRLSDFRHRLQRTRASSTDDCSPNKNPNTKDCSPNKNPNTQDCSPNKNPNTQDCSPNRTPNTEDCSPNKNPNTLDCSPNRRPN